MAKTAKCTVQPSPGVGVEVGPRSWQQPGQGSLPSTLTQGWWPRLDLNGDAGISIGQKCF